MDLRPLNIFQPTRSLASPAPQSPLRDHAFKTFAVPAGASSRRRPTSAGLVAVRPDDDVAKVVRLMRDEAVRRVPVVDGDQAVGILSIGDLARALDADSALADISAAPPSD